MYSKIQYISSGNTLTQQLKHIQRVLDSGVDWIQVRFKNGNTSSLLRLAEKVKLLQQRYNFTFIINDHLSIAQQVDADGVHLGLKDQPIAIARQLLGCDKIIGGTANTYQDVQQRIAEGCNYIGLGPLRFTRSKENLSPILGAAGYTEIIEQLKDHPHPPIYAIGGVTLDDVDQLSAIGLYGIALSSALEQKLITL